MSRPWKWVLASGILLLLLTMGAYYVALRRADDVIQRHEADAREKLAAFEARVFLRPPLEAWPADRPESEKPTDARPIYRHAIRLIDKIPEEEQGVLDLYWGGRDEEKAAEAEVRAVFRSHRQILDVLREARYADRISAEPALSRAFGGEYGDHVGWQDLGSHLRMAAQNALALREHERVRELVELQILMGRDYARTGETIHRLTGEYLADYAVDDARHLLTLGVLDTEATKRFADVLDRLAPNRSPLSETWKVTSASLRALCIYALRTSDWDLFDTSEAVGWRHLYSARVWGAEALDLLPGRLERLHPLDDLLPIDAWHEAQRIVDEAEHDDHEIVHMVTVIAPMVYRKRARSLQRWHLLRVGTAVAGYRAEHGRWPETLDDLVPAWLERVAPCPATGLPLGYAKGKLWASGGDGDDDGGRPPSNPEDWASDGDVVFDLSDKTPPER